MPKYFTVSLTKHTYWPPNHARRRKMADVLDVDVEDKGGFSEDEGDGKNFTS